MAGQPGLRLDPGSTPEAAGAPAAARPVLIAGGGGALAGCFARLCAARGLPHRVLSRRELDVADPASVAAAVARLRPWAVINGAGYARVDRAEREAERCRRENVRGAEVLAGACAQGRHQAPRLLDPPRLRRRQARALPRGGRDGTARRLRRQQGRGRAALLAACPDALLVRSGAFFGPWDERNVAARTLRAAAQGREVAAACDVAVSPTYLPHLGDLALDLLIDGETGLVNLASAGAVTWAEFAREVVRGVGLDPSRVRPVPAAELGWLAPRPRQSVLRSARISAMPSLEHGIGCYVDAVRRQAAGDGRALAVAEEAAGEVAAAA